MRWFKLHNKQQLLYYANRSTSQQVGKFLSNFLSWMSFKKKNEIWLCFARVMLCKSYNLKVISGLCVVCVTDREAGIKPAADSLKLSVWAAPWLPVDHINCSPWDPAQLQVTAHFHIMMASGRRQEIVNKRVFSSSRHWPDISLFGEKKK